MSFFIIHLNFNQFISLINIQSFLCLTVQRPVDIKNRPRIPIPDEDPYSEAAVSASSSGSSGLGGSGSADGGIAGKL